MDFQFQGLTLNNTFYPTKQLVEFCTFEIENNKVPDWCKNVYRFILQFVNDEQFILQRTSGSTGEPKDIELLKAAMVASAQLTAKTLRLSKNETALLCLPVDYIAGKMMVVRAIVTGLNLILTEPSSTPETEKYPSVDFCAMVPLQVHHLIRNETLKRIKTLIIGGAAIGPELKQILSGFPNTIFETYGMTETCSHIALKKISGNNTDSHFRALEGIIFEKQDNGCLTIRAPFLAEPMYTTDLVELIDLKSFKLIGRLTETINSGGLKIQPEEMEKKYSKIIQHPCAVIGKEDPVLGQKLVLFVETNLPDFNPKLYIDLLSEKLDKKFVPKEIVALKKLPRNKSFKIDRKVLQIASTGSV